MPGEAGMNEAWLIGGAVVFVAACFGIVWYGVTKGWHKP